MSDPEKPAPAEGFVTDDDLRCMISQIESFAREVGRTPVHLGRTINIYRELLALRETLTRAQALATRERDRRLEAERARDEALAELALIRRAWVSAPPAPYSYPDATG